MAVERKNIIAIRLTDEEYEPFRVLLESSNISKSDFFRSLILSRVIEIPPPQKSKTTNQDYKKLLFYVNKTSNNINQIAKRLNVANKRAVVSESTFIKAMNALISIRDGLLGALK
ncbi:plasmid mobilization relaxosome protein MobC [Plesiomonas shigelloides]|uniref:plasmid mobilization protein n=1 Tax=Plesiomonas shigelloides TaxID=703 RepID=UPI0012623373|nr:plasmid mobilization relaxosome protein MobC [Plesiomonas shigelloides]KAB7685425.1 plasmid mobilization relaxosome protein MobC [Plesiomonas shigelloides]